MSEHLRKGDLENHSKAWSFRLAQGLNIILFLRKTSQGSIVLVRRFFFSGIFLGCALCLRKEFGKDILAAQPTDETKVDAEARNDSKSIEGDFIHRHPVEPRVQVHVPKEEIFPIPLKCMNVTRTTHTFGRVARKP